MIGALLSPASSSSICLSLTALGKFVCQATYIWKFMTFNKIKLSRNLTKYTLIILLPRKQFILLQVMSITLLFGEFAINSLYSF